MDKKRPQLMLRIMERARGLFESSIEKNIRTEQLFAEADKHHQDIADCLRTRPKTSEEYRKPEKDSAEVIWQSLFCGEESKKGNTKGGTGDSFHPKTKIPPGRR